MKSNTSTFHPRRVERFFLVLASLVLAFLFFNLYTTLQQDFSGINNQLQNGTTVNLNAPQAAQTLKRVLQKGYYFEDARDVNFITSVLSKRLNGDSSNLDNIGALNKKAFFVNAMEAEKNGGAVFKKRVALSRLLLGFSGLDSLRYQKELQAPPAFGATNHVTQGEGKINVRIQTKNGTPAAGVLVRLQLVLPQDSIYGSAKFVNENAASSLAKPLLLQVAERANGATQLQALTAYARTNADGECYFEGLPENSAYEVLPLQPGFQFGAAKGTPNLDGSSAFSFIQDAHTIRLFASRDFTNLKAEKALIVRLPSQFNFWFVFIVAGFFTVFLLVHLFLSWKLPAADALLVPILMLLTGLSFIALFSLQQPLSDRFLAKNMFGYFAFGMAGLLVLQFFNLRHFTPASKIYALFLKKRELLAENGLQWAAFAALVLILLLLFGSGPEGSGVKVNLFGFQPSELVKYATVLFMAGFFARTETFISGYKSWQKRWAFLRIALFAILGTIGLFLLIGDLGPAMVCCFTFIILFSFSRGDFGMMAAAVLAYVLLLWGFENVWLATGAMAGLLALYFFVIQKEVSESALMAVVVMAAFLLVDQLPLLAYFFPGPVARLADRKAIWMNAWNNEVFGGDHVANSIWALASGGFGGQGVGHGFAKTIPEAHTDMILPALGEEFGLLLVISICLLFLVYLHRALLIGRQTGTPFLFYLSAGIGISTFVQFILIAGGSTGALPLSGVSLPFVSYGGASLVCNLIGAGFLLSTSSVRGTPIQMQYIIRQQDKNLMPALLAACAALLLFAANVSRYALQNKKWIVEPALVADRNGARLFSYNPRLGILMDRLEAGAVYDRGHRLLATSSNMQIKNQHDSLAAAGLLALDLERLEHKRQARYYPFGAHAFFWTGDANTGVFNGGNNGYFADYRHNATLRGFNAPATTVTAAASRFRESRFLPQRATETNLAKIDYSALAPMLLAGIESNAVREFKKKNRDLQLSLDAALQTALQNSLASDSLLSGKRTSVVVMSDSTGDVLASAMQPLPPVADWDVLHSTFKSAQSGTEQLTDADLGFAYATQPGSTAKLATALAAFNKLGMEATEQTYLVRSEDRIRVNSDEPDETGNISMARAIVNSNNVYFIRLANEARLEQEMATVYQQTGMFLRGLGGYYYTRDTGNFFQQDRWRQTWDRTEFQSRKRYDKQNVRATRGLGISGMAWGQGELVATPAAVARLAAGISNNGVLVPHRFVLRVADSTVQPKKGIALAAQPQYSQQLTSYMKAQSAPKQAVLGLTVAGKTGTPERLVAGKRINDGWYVFFAPAEKGLRNAVVCIRIENCKGSSEAVRLAGRIVIPILKRMGYLKSADTPLKP